MTTSSHSTLPEKHRWVVKIGSALLTRDGKGLATSQLDQWVAQIARLIKSGHEVVLVSSGAVAQGMAQLGWSERPTELHLIQSAAAVGQMGLIQAYEVRFQKHQLHTAQILLVHADLSARTGYLNARQTLQSLLSLGVVPIVNENDTVATDELRFGDNDSLAGLVANLIDADRLVILTDQDGVFTKDPRNNPDAMQIKTCDVHDSQLDKAASASGGALGRGGMISKIQAARLAARSGTCTYIANGLQVDVLQSIADQQFSGTLLTNTRKPIAARKQWLAGGLKCQGQLQLDDGAVKVLKESGSSLLPVGVQTVAGQFQRGDLVSCIDSKGREIARGMTNYNSEDALKIAGQPSKNLLSILGYSGKEEIIHRDDLVVL